LKKPFIYLIRKKAIGDVLWIEPVIRQLASRHRKVIVSSKYPELFANYPLPNVVIKKGWLNVFEKLALELEHFLKRAFFFVDLNGAYESNPRTHILSAYQQKAGLPLTHEYPRLYLNEQELAFRPPVPGRYVVLHLESLADKNYRKVHAVDWAQVVDSLKARGLEVVVIGQAPVSIAGVLYLKTSMREMISLLHGAAFFIGIDSGPSHLAAALDIPSLIFFGAVNPDFRHFRQLFKGRFLQQDCEYAGCYHETTKPEGAVCRLVGHEGIPKCSLHSTEYVLRNIDAVVRDYHITTQATPPRLSATS
jgi:ADP-heptose:LPS heptosyltransferase